MPNLSDKGIYLPPSPIRKLVPFAEAAKRRGIKVYHLNIGQPDIRTPQVAVDAVKNIHDQVFEYGTRPETRAIAANWPITTGASAST